MTKQMLGTRVLLVESELLIAAALIRELEHLGATVVAAVSTVRAAIPIAETVDIDLAVVETEVMDGATYPLVDILVARGVSCVFQTSHLRELPRRHATRPRWIKPYSPQDMVASLASLTEHERQTLH
jgi:DNA-binding response OmpR family regulator